MPEFVREIPESAKCRRGHRVDQILQMHQAPRAVQTPLFQPFPMLPGRRAQAWQHQPAYRRPRHFHLEPELNLVFSGRAKMGVGEHQFEMVRGDVLLLRPGQDHEMLEASSDLDLFVVALTPEIANAVLRLGLPVDPRPFRLPEQDLDRLRDKLGALREASDPLSPEWIVGELFASCESKLAWGHPVARKTLAAVQSDPQLQFDALARRLKIGAGELGRHFHKELGLKLVDFRTRIRLMLFVEHFGREGVSLTRAAAAAGFGSYAQAHRSFRHYLGCSPREYFSGRQALINDLLAPLPVERGAPLSSACDCR